MKAAAIRRILIWLWEVHGAPKLDDGIRRYKGVRPRNVTATREEIDAILDEAMPHLRLWLLLCSDLAIRSGTAAIISPEHYSEPMRELRFASKFDNKQMLPVTEEIAELFSRCDLHSRMPFVRQLWHQDRPGDSRLNDGKSGVIALRWGMRQLLKKCGINRRITPHDLRRTAAVAMLENSHDVRDVQALLGHRSLTSTLWYLDHDLRPVSRSVLEQIKLPAWRKEQSA